jgi:hypothetical protein
VDHQTGQALKHTINPDELGTYYDNDDSKLHYLTPAYFKREVLQPYASEPGKYRLTVNRLSCLNLWGVDISINTAGLVEVYLGDLGRDIPSDEWGHWLSYNVPPEGNMEEGRFRRDFFNQPASSLDPVGDLRRARQRVADLSGRVLGSRLWRPLEGSLRNEFESLIGPLTDDRAALGPALLVLTKAVVDAIDPGVLKSHVSVVEKSDQSLSLLQRFVVEWGGDADTVGILRELQAFRSRGGVAHLENSGSGKAAAALGIAGMSNLDSFNSIVVRLTASLIAIADLIAPRVSVTDGDDKSAALQT